MLGSTRLQPRRVRPAGVAAGALMVCARAFAAGPAIRLRSCTVAMSAAPPAVLTAFRDHIGATPGLLCRTDDTAIARFSGQAGLYRFTTTELIRFAADRVEFEHLGGPFRSCLERFVAADNRDGTTTVVHDGVFRMRYGLAGWLVGLAVARPLFETVSERDLCRLPQRLRIPPAADRADTSQHAPPAPAGLDGETGR